MEIHCLDLPVRYEVEVLSLSRISYATEDAHIRQACEYVNLPLHTFLCKVSEKQNSILTVDELRNR